MKAFSQAPQRTAGTSLVELMVALAIGVFLIGGALSVYIKSREIYVLNETLARMQENATFALKQMEPDIQLAGYWGAHSDIGSIETVTAAVSNECDTGWATRVSEYLAGSNNTRPDWVCLPEASYKPQTDVLTVRRASATPVTTLVSGPIYMRSSSLPRSRLFTGTTQPSGFPPEAQNFLMHARAYYVKPASGANDAPSLRRVELASLGSGAVVRDREVVRGVDDFQIQLGVDSNGDQAVDAYVDPDNPLVAISRVLSVRVWLLMRAEDRELGYVDDIGYTLGDTVRPATDDPYRRMLVTRTIMLRNRT